MYQLGSLFIFGSKLISVLGIALRMSCCLFPKIQMVAGGCFFPPRKFLFQQNHIDFDIKGL